MRILAVIPARGGSKGIPKKNIRLMHNKPLISYAIENAKKSTYITDIFVTTDSFEIAEVSRQYGAEIIMRDEKLSSDLVTLDPVIYHAMINAEKIKKCTYDVIITLQPTSPLLESLTLDKAIEVFLIEHRDTLISAVNKPRLSWGKKEGQLVPLYLSRKNRQELPPQYSETGAFVISLRNVVQPNTRIGNNVSVYEVPEVESIDIDDKNDWILTENIFRRKTIIFRADGYINLGMGHIYNCITLAYSLLEHNVLLVTHKDANEGIIKIKESNLPYKIIENEQDINLIIDEFHPDIWVNDCLDTNAEYIKMLKNKIKRVVTIEDLGTGITEADAVINALYENEKEQNNVYSGYKYVCLRDEFQLEKPAQFSDKVRKILVMFGGTDPLNLNKMLYDIILGYSHKHKDIKFEFITGIGYDFLKNGVITQKDKNIFVYPNVSRVTAYMKNADLAITSQGRTIFELASMHVPAIVLSQNEREATHSFAQMEHGFLNLGMGEGIESSMVENTLDWLVNTPIVRKNMYMLMSKLPLRSGLERVKNIILGGNNE